MYFELECKYDDLQSEYSDLYDRYAEAYCNWEDTDIELTSLYEDIGSLEDDLIAVYGFFEGGDYTFEDAFTSFKKIDSTIYSILYPDE